MKNELMKESLFNDLESMLDDMALLCRDYGYDLEECAEDEDSCEENDEDIFVLYTAYKQLRKMINQDRY